MSDKELKPVSFESSFDDFNDDTIVPEPVVSKKGWEDSSIAKILNAIYVTKNVNLLDDPVIEKEFNAFVILRFISMNEEYCELVNLVNRVHGPMDSKMVFKLLIKLIPRGKVFSKYIKAAKIEDDISIINISKYYEISLREARQYFKIMGKDWADEISGKVSNNFERNKKSKKGKK